MGGLLEDWDDYRYFLAVAKEGSLSAAARQLKVSQPTVSRRITQLEDRLGTRLFDQLPSGVKLTLSGRDIVGTAETLENTAIALRRKIAGREATLEGPISISVTPTFANYWLAERIAKFSNSHPEIVVTCRADNQHSNLAKREADIAIRFGRPKSCDLVGSRIGYVHCGIFGSEAYLEAHGEPTTITDLRRHQLIDAAEPIAQFQQCRDLKALMRDAVVSCKANCTQTYIALAVAGQGLISTPCYVLAHTPALRRVLADQYDRTIELWMLVHPDLKGCARIRALMDFLRDEIRADRDTLTGR